MRRSPSETKMFSVVSEFCAAFLSRRLAGKLFHIRGPAAAKHLSPKRLWNTVSTFSPKKTWGNKQDFLRRGEYRQPGSQVLCLTALGIPSWPSWIQLVVWPATNEVDAISVWCVCNVWLLWSALPQHSAPTVLAAWVCRHSVQQGVAVVQSTRNERLD